MNSYNKPIPLNHRYNLQRVPCAVDMKNVTISSVLVTYNIKIRRVKLPMYNTLEKNIV